MTAIKGFSTRGLKDQQDLIAGTTTKRDSETQLFATVVPMGPNRTALDTMAFGLFAAGLADIVEAGSTQSVVNATAHVARPGDFIRFTASANGITTIDIPVKSTTANTITLNGALDQLPLAADTFDILRPVPPLYTSSGAAASGPIQFVYDGVDTSVLEDTVTPANNRPLPVKITSATGDINITAGDLNVQLTHTGATPDSVQLGDGTEILLISTAGEALTLPSGNVADNAADAGNPIKVGGKYNAVAPTYGDGDRADLQVSVSGRLLTDAALASAVAANAPDTENPIKVGARYDLALPTYDDGDKVNLQTDANGRLHVVASGATTSSYAEDTASVGGALGTGINWVRQDAPIVDTSLDGDYTFAKSTNRGELWVANLRLEALLPASLGTKANAASLAVTLSTEQDARLAAMETSLGLLDNAIAGTEMQVDLVGLGGAATEAKQDAAIVLLTSMDADTGNIDAKLPATLGQKTTATSLAVVLPSDAVIPAAAGRTAVDKVRNDYTGTPVTTGAWVELDASLFALCNEIEIFDSSGQTLEFGIGAAAAEVSQFYIVPGGNGRIPITIPAATRTAVRAVSANATVGEIVINFFS